MRYFLFLTAVVTALFTVSCVGEFENIEKYSGETVYPASFDTIIVSYGFERVEFDLCKAGRLPSSEMKLGKAVRTVVEFDENRIVYDEVRSWVNITDLNISRMYRFKIYTEDEFGNYSMPQSMAVIPYTQSDIDNMNFPMPSWLRSSTSVVVEFPASVVNQQMTHNGLSWKYSDASAQIQTGEIDGLRFFASNFTPSSNISIEVTHKIIPKLNDPGKTSLLDEVTVTRTIQTQLPSSADPFVPAEREILEANGITDFTPAGVASVTKLVYPLYTSSFQDLFYLPNVKELDLTGEGLSLPVMQYDRNGIRSTIGGGEWQPFMRRVHKESDINMSGIATLLDLIEAGQLTKVRLFPGGRMGIPLEEALKPHEGTIVEFVDNFPNEVFIHPQFFVNGWIQDGNWRMDHSYSGDFLPREGNNDVTKFDPTNDKVNTVPVDLKLSQLIQSDGKNIYRCVMRSANASFWFGLPTQYMFDSREYRYLKFKLFCGTDPEDMNTKFFPMWLRIMNYTWAFPGESSYGQWNWNYDIMPEVPKIYNDWVECVGDMNENDWWGNDINTLGNGEGSRRNRVIVINFGREAGTGFSWDESKQLVFYVADIRLCKNP